MKAHILAVALLGLASSVASADDLSTKAMKDHPGESGAGTTANPTAKPNSGSLSEKQMQEQPGVNTDSSGKTSAPTAKGDENSLSGKVMKDQLKSN